MLKKHPKGEEVEKKLSRFLTQASNLIISNRVRINTACLMAAWVEEKVLSNVWWPVTLKTEDADLHAKALILWLNSTLGLFLSLGMRQETRGAWIQFKKDMWESLPVLDVGKLSKEALATLAEAFDAVKGQPLQPFSALKTDAVRLQIDEVVGKVLGLRGLDSLREALSREPILTLKPLYPTKEKD
jgi:hypothetical protein